MTILLPDGEIDKFISRNVCSRCYGDLQKYPAKGRLWEAGCPVCGDAWHETTIKRYTAEKRGQAGLAEIREVKSNLPDLFPNPHKGKSTEELIKELGF